MLRIGTRPFKLVKTSLQKVDRVKSSSRTRCYQSIQSFSFSSSLPPQSSHPKAKKSSNGSGHSQRGPITFFTLGITALVCGGVVIYYGIEKDRKIENINQNKPITSGKPALGGPWSLVDQDGVPRTSADYLGKFTLLYFGFTHCPDICPSELVKVGKIMELLEKKGLDASFVPIFISVDPVRDTIGQIRCYAQDFHKSMIYLTGTNEQVGKAAKVYRVYFSKANESPIDLDGNADEEYLVDHSIVLYLHSPDGEFLDFFTQKTQVYDIVSRIEQYMKDYKKQQQQNERKS